MAYMKMFNGDERMLYTKSAMEAEYLTGGHNQRIS